MQLLLRIYKDMIEEEKLFLFVPIYTSVMCFSAIQVDGFFVVKLRSLCVMPRREKMTPNALVFCFT